MRRLKKSKGSSWPELASYALYFIKGLILYLIGSDNAALYKKIEGLVTGKCGKAVKIMMGFETV